MSPGYVSKKRRDLAVTLILNDSGLHGIMLPVGTRAINTDNVEPNYKLIRVSYFCDISTGRKWIIFVTEGVYEDHSFNASAQ